MPLLTNVIDPKSARTITVQSVTETRDSNGNVTNSTATVTTYVGDVQPLVQRQTSERQTGGASVEAAGYLATHASFPTARLSGVAEKMYLLDSANSVRYRIVSIADWGQNFPQELYLVRATNLEA